MNVKSEQKNVIHRRKNLIFPLEQSASSFNRYAKLLLQYSHSMQNKESKKYPFTKRIGNNNENSRTGNKKERRNRECANNVQTIKTMHIEPVEVENTQMTDETMLCNENSWRPAREGWASDEEKDALRVGIYNWFHF